MRLLTQTAILSCAHTLGIVGIFPSQSLVSIVGRKVLVVPDTVGKPILGCPNLGPTIKPCLATLTTKSGYSSFVRISGRSVCLDAVCGLTDGTPPGMVEYQVRSPGQDFVSAMA